MLKDSFYTLIALNRQPSSANITLQLNEKHAIYNGHFPEQPIVPGACLLQIIKEIVEVILESKLQMLRADELKFLLPVNPVNDNILQGSINYVIDDKNQINVVANLFQNGNVGFKCKAAFVYK
jgi:3-hydroxyacyl-[acyl-carrier-protein] dehydratase